MGEEEGLLQEQVGVTLTEIAHVPQMDHAIIALQDGPVFRIYGIFTLGPHCILSVSDHDVPATTNTNLLQRCASMGVFYSYMNLYELTRKSVNSVRFDGSQSKTSI